MQSQREKFNHSQKFEHKQNEPGVLTCIYNREVEAGRLQVEGQPGLNNEKLSQKNNNINKQKQKAYSVT
jgi:hypothetical protein